MAEGRARRRNRQAVARHTDRIRHRNGRLQRVGRDGRPRPGEAAVSALQFDDPQDDANGNPITPCAEAWYLDVTPPNLGFDAAADLSESAYPDFEQPCPGGAVTVFPVQSSASSEFESSYVAP
jgi:hypothetical protein